MTISTKGRYALRMMLEFALHPNECTTINQVSERQHISVKYLEQLVSKLSRAGYVKSVRGAQGGYYLVNDPRDYTIGMILRQAEGNLAPVTCLEEDFDDCPRSHKCAALSVWKKLDEAICGVVDTITLADLVEEQARIDEEQNHLPA